ncbi:hypothetical protein [Corynebacterium tuscaniense]|uniref:hypothetical protein n=1 Tax=Corynebacterium tuscaniense TaxID=302449 RepID=UPI00050DBF8C|nr:hypothetical protein [Corynebacterium tuscaniense]KAA8738438.1 hypothetical protein F4V54_05810 [Corynebacterium tuscaniense]KGF24383.1 hypothetical protein HMPREF2129_02210 [Corynebacterium tuscaniense DNF00037]
MTPQPRTDFTPGEARAGITWLSVGALVTLLVEVGSLDKLWGIPAIVAAWVLGGVGTKTGRLWTSKSTIALVPTWTWLVGLALLYMGPDVTRELLRTHHLPALLLLAAGTAGGIWPLLRDK